jgi:hypothetical protein
MAYMQPCKCQNKIWTGSISYDYILMMGLFTYYIVQTGYYFSQIKTFLKNY